MTCIEDQKIGVSNIKKMKIKDNPELVLGSKEFGNLNSYQKKEFLKSVCLSFTGMISNSFKNEDYFVNLSIELDANIYEESGSQRIPVIIQHIKDANNDQIPYLLGVQIKMKPIWKWNKVLYEALGNSHLFLFYIHIFQ